MLPRVVALALLACLAAVPAAEARRTVPRGFLGMNWDGSLAAGGSRQMYKQQFGRIAAAGGETVRATFSWAHAQPEKDGPFEMSATDRIVAAASARHLSVLPVVILAPRWARRGQSDDYPFTPPASYFEYTAYLTALVERYGPDGTFWDENPTLPRMPIREWQIWNEPHLQYQWTIAKGEDWANQYAWLVRFARAAVKASDPGGRIVLAGLSNDSWKYLRKLYIEGIGDQFDVAAIHPYTRTPAGVVELVRRFRRVMRQYGDRTKPVYVTELSLPAAKRRSKSASPLKTSDSGMARFLHAAYARLAAARRSPRLRVSRAYWYTWASGYRGRNVFGYAGLFRYRHGHRTKRRPAYRMYVHVARRLEGCAKTTAARCR